MKRQRLQRKQKKWINLIFYFKVILLIFMVFFWGCGEKTTTSPITQKPKSSPAEKKPVEAVKVVEKKEPEKTPEVEYSYNPLGKPDPFKPFIQISPIKEARRAVPLTPLQKYEITQLKLVAIILTSEGNVAMVEDSTGKGYIVKKGTLIGKNDGKVSKILKDKIIIEEPYQDVLGQTKINEVIMTLHRPEEGGES